MRYLLHESQLPEMAARKQYLLDAFHLYFLPGTPEGKYTPFLPIGDDNTDVVFITGHTNLVLDYLTSYIDQIPERNIVITSCNGNKFKQFSGKKRIYVANTSHGACVIRNGEPFGYGFNISDAELDFVNTTGDIMSRVRSTYHLL